MAPMKRMLLHSLLTSHHHGNASRHFLHSAMAFSHTSHRCRSSSHILTAAAATKRRRRGRLRRTARIAAATQDDDTTTQYTINDATCPPTNAADLKRIVHKHIETLPKYLQSKPIAGYNSEAFEQACEFVRLFRFRLKQQQQLNDDDQDEDRRVNVILDSGCGTGRSTRLLGEMFPDCAVIGIDRSLARLNKNREYRNRHDHDDYNMNLLDEQDKDPHCNNLLVPLTNNTLLLRADLVDFWHQCLTSSTWQSLVHVQRHYILYPNPYPKKARLKSRFYAHPAFSLLMLTVMNRNDNSCSKYCDGLVIRSNWRGYLEEFALALQVWEEAGLSSQTVHQQQQCLTNDLANVLGKTKGESRWEWTIDGPARIDCETNLVPMTNFEAKYFACGEPVYELQVKQCEVGEE